MRISFANQKGVLASYNSRAEHHGEELVPACDVTLIVNVTNGVLAHFDPTLRSFLYHYDKARAERGEADLADQGSESPHIRIPDLEMPLRMKSEMIGGRLIVHHGIGGESDLVLDPVKVNGFRINARDGGTVELKFRCQGQPDARFAGVVSRMRDQELEFTLEEPKADGESVE